METTYKSRRIVTIGNSCSGKSTSAHILSHKRDIPYYDLDTYYWTNAWQKRPTEDFRNDVDAISTSNNWVIAGNCVSTISDLLWPRATTLIYLEIPLYRVLWNYVRRTASRIYYRIPTAGGNYETITRQFTRKSLGLHIIHTYTQKKQLYRYYMEHPPDPNLTTVHISGYTQLQQYIHNTHST